MSEILSNEDIESFILNNKQKVEKRGEVFEVDRDSLHAILSRLNSYNVIQDRRQRIIKKATRILAGISYYQPFNDGNKETAHSMTIFFLQRNSFNLLND